MAKVLLVNPPFYRLLNSHYNANSLGIAYVASYLNSQGHNAWLYNADFLNSKTFLKQKNIFEGFDSYKKFFQNWGKNMCHTKEFFDFYNMIWILLKIAPQP